MSGGGTQSAFPTTPALIAPQQQQSTQAVTISIQTPIAGNIGEEVGEEIMKVLNLVGGRNVKLDLQVVEGFA